MIPVSKVDSDAKQALKRFLMEYAFSHNGKAYTPDGPVPVTDIDTHNRQVEAAEIAHLQTGPDRVFLYVRMPTTTDAHAAYGWAMGHGMSSCCKLALIMGGTACPICQKPISQERYDRTCDIQTWLGTPVGTHVYIGRAYKVPGFGGWPSTRRSVSCRIFGRTYYGTYYESSGNYCRLRRVKWLMPRR